MHSVAELLPFFFKQNEKYIIFGGGNERDNLTFPLTSSFCFYSTEIFTMTDGRAALSTSKDGDHPSTLNLTGRIRSISTGVSFEQ